MSIFDAMIAVMAAPTLVGFVCRLSMLDVRTHCALPILMHSALAVAVAWAGYHALVGDGTIGDAATVLGALAWIILSLDTWRHGVPTHFLSAPKLIDEIQWPHISGGKE